MKAAEIRSTFLNYFQKNSHQIVESSSLVPSNDPTLLFTNAGMVQFKDVFLGKDKRPYARATTSQKCLRAGGKHNDLENVGFTARHHTFFEMLGNFSFGDYFKKDAIRFAWEFVTKELKLPKDKLWVSVFREDDEAAEIWHKQEGVSLDRIVRFDEKDNFWSMGDTGPCGPCSEIYIDRGPKYGGPECGKTKVCNIGCDCDRFMEFWNLVFMQFDRDASGKLNPLPRPSVDTGAGLERIALILQDAETNYDTDLFTDIISKTEKLSGKKYDPKDAITASFRVVADHSRASTFLIGDGVMPSNEGRGYVLRRIIRRAIRHGYQKLGFTKPFLNKTSGFVIDQMSGAYPDLIEKRSYIEKVILAEEEQFFRTIERGIGLFNETIESLNTKIKNWTFSGATAFKLYDTFGFPLDLTRVMVTELGGTIDEAGFEAEMEKQRSESRKHWKGSGEEATDTHLFELKKQLGTNVSKFDYESLSLEGECLGFVSDGSGHELAVFSPTPFYGESGGQVGDRGIVSGSGYEGQVLDVQKFQDLTVVKLKAKKGTLAAGKKYTQQTDEEIRALTAKNHTATHLLHWALRDVLGKHVQQKGSLVTPELLRFDFSHTQPMTEAELTRVENMINERIWKSKHVSKKEMNKDAAIKAGAIAMFGEKYADTVRVVSVGDFSVELCGGTHVNNSSDIHVFKIGNESGIAAGVRRIIAYTSAGAFEFLRKNSEYLKTVQESLKATATEEIIPKIEKLQTQEKDLRKQIEKLQSKSAAGAVDELISQAESKSGVKWIVGELPSQAEGMKRLRETADQVKSKSPDSVSILGMIEEGSNKPVVAIIVGLKAPKTANASEILKELLPMIDGKGGGKPDMAQAGGTKADGLKPLLAKAKTLMAKYL
ncbi:MAG: alanine--tRNA ligase [Xanthomonadaceae bacterium]|nr:alanine--tRNA ligase [Xanthomonadaceae bacterium]